MSRVGITAFGVAPFTRDDARIEDVLLDAAAAALRSNPAIDRGKIDSVIVSTNDDSKYLGAILAETAGISPKSAMSVENLCSSGANAVATAYAQVASGLAGTVLVAGADLHGGPGQVLGWDKSRGEFAHPLYWGSLFTRAYRERYHISEEEMAFIPAKNRRQATANPDALPSTQCTVKDVLDSARVTDDLRLYDCSRPCTGGACVVVSSERAALECCGQPVWITGIGQRTVSAGFAKGGAPHLLESAADAARQAFAMAGAGPGDVGVAELHDAFSVCEAMALEAVGLAGRGRGPRMAQELYETGDPRINPRGGLIGAGHPLGATGIAQAAEVAAQLRGEAGPRQADRASAGLVHNMSAAATSSTVLVMQC